MPPAWLCALSPFAALLFVPGVASAEPAPDLPLPPCTMVDGVETGACIRDNPYVTLPSPGVFSAGSALSVTPTPSVPACVMQDIVNDEYSPAPCYSAIRAPSIGSCYYIDLTDGDTWKSGSCSDVLYIEPPTLDVGLFTIDGPSGCRDEFNTVYIYGGPANVPGARWSERAPDALPCQVTFNGPRPDGLLGPTWVKVSANLVARNPLTPEGGIGEAYVRIDGDLLPEGTVEMDVEETQMTIPDHKGDPNALLEFSVVTTYGDTATRVELLAKDDDGAPLEGADIRFSVDPATDEVMARVGVARSRNAGLGVDEVTVTTGADGRATAWLNTSDLYLAGGPGQADLRVTARLGASIVTDSVTVFDNLDSLVDAYTGSTEIPNGAVNAFRVNLRPPLDRTSVAGWVFDTALRLGNANGYIGYDDGDQLFCQNYQTLTLLFLNRMRHDPDEAWRLNGLDYGPVQVVDTDHHYVVVYPTSEGVDGESLQIFDPWPSQTPVVYSREEYDLFPGLTPFRPDTRDDPNLPGTCFMRCRSKRFDEVLPFFYPTAGGVYPYFAANEGKPLAPPGNPYNPSRFDGCFYVPPDWCQQNGYGDARIEKGKGTQTAASGSLYVGSPVVFHLDYGDDLRYGFTSATEFENTLGDIPTGYMPLPEPDDEEGWYVDLPLPGAFDLTMTALETGEMTILLNDADGEIWGSFSNVPVVEGESYVIPVDFDKVCKPLSLSDGTSAPCVCADADGDGIGDECTRDGCGGCSMGRAGGGSLGLVLALVGALAARRRRMRARSRWAGRPSDRRAP